MKSFDTLLSRFCYKHPRFGIPNLMTVIVAGTVLVYLLDMFSTTILFSDLLVFSPALILQGQVWRLFTFLFIPDSSYLLLLALSLYFYWLIGNVLEQQWGTAKFNFYYFLGVVLNIILGFVSYALGGSGEVSITYVNLSLFFAFATLYPDMQVYIFFILPVKVKWLAWLDAALFLWMVVSSLIALNFLGALMPIIALLNYLLFFWSDLADSVRRMVGRAAHQTSRQTINFKKAARQAQQHKGYIHKCAVCGKTDTDYPDMEFRYCSKCNGYYCYCKDHINDHVHIQ